MQFITDTLVAVLAGYLAVTNLLATEIESWFSTAEPSVPMVQESETAVEEPLRSLPSRISQAIPNILLQSAEYQQAAVSTAGDLSGATTNDPLEALVNILCTLTTDEYIRTTTGTGFFVDPDGVIMTNAHVAQFLLLEATNDFGEAECIIRAGNPAAPQYHAELLYLSPAWVQENASTMNADVPMGTGERDYALLYVSRRVDDAPLPAVFPALSLDTELLPLTIKGTSVVASGYPAGNLLRNGPSADLIPLKASTTISELYTFGSNYADVFSMRGSIVGTEGASGGPVVGENNGVIGMIATRGDDAIDGIGSLRAITLSHIDRTIQEETGFTLQQNVAGNLPYRAEIFADTLAPFLLSLLELEQSN